MQAAIALNAHLNRRSASNSTGMAVGTAQQLPRQFPELLTRPVGPRPFRIAPVALRAVPESVVPTMRSAAVSRGQSVPVDFCADPDGAWNYDELLEAANFDPAWGKVEVGALTQAYRSFPEGSAVVTLRVGERLSTVLIDCTLITQ